VLKYVALLTLTLLLSYTFNLLDGQRLSCRRQVEVRAPPRCYLLPSADITLAFKLQFVKVLLLVTRAIASPRCQISLYSPSRFSTRNRYQSASSATMSEPSKSGGPPFTQKSLGQFLAVNKERYLYDVSKGVGHRWTVVIGNESGGTTVVFRVMTCFSSYSSKSRP
jgi:hypothetical protein